MATNIIPLPAAGEPGVVGAAAESTAPEPTRDASTQDVEVSFDAILQQLTEAVPVVEPHAPESIESELVLAESELEADDTAVDPESAIVHSGCASGLSPECIDAYLALGQPIEVEADGEVTAEPELVATPAPIDVLNLDLDDQAALPPPVQTSEDTPATPALDVPSTEAAPPLAPAVAAEDAPETVETPVERDTSEPLPITAPTETAPNAATTTPPKDTTSLVERRLSASDLKTTPLDSVDLEIDVETNAGDSIRFDQADAPVAVTQPTGTQEQVDPNKLTTTVATQAPTAPTTSAPSGTVRKPSARPTDPTAGPDIPEPELELPSSERSESQIESQSATFAGSADPDPSLDVSFAGNLGGQPGASGQSGSAGVESLMTGIPIETRVEPSAAPNTPVSLEDASNFSVEARPETTTVRGETVYRSLPGGMGEQVVAAVHQTLNSPEGSTEKAIFLELQPPELGRLRIRVEQGVDSIATHIVASEASSSDLLSSRRDTLQNALSELGFGEASVDISSSQDGQFFDDREFDQRQNSDSTHRYSRESERPEPIESRESDSGLNIIA
ncbi:MAG: flagellar hook-length control protein FliK [Planctomycetota bacterium]